MFKEFSSLEHIYTSFPEGKITRDRVDIDTKNGKELLEALEKQGINVSLFARGMIESSDFMPAQITEIVDIVRLKVRDLGFTNFPTTTEVFEKATELGLELCPAEVGPQYRLQQTNQPMDDWFSNGVPVLGNDHKTAINIPTRSESLFDYDPGFTQGPSQLFSGLGM